MTSQGSLCRRSFLKQVGYQFHLVVGWGQCYEISGGFETSPDVFGLVTYLWGKDMALPELLKGPPGYWGSKPELSMPMVSNPACPKWSVRRSAVCRHGGFGGLWLMKISGASSWILKPRRAGVVVSRSSPMGLSKVSLGKRPLPRLVMP